MRVRFPIRVMRLTPSMPATPLTPSTPSTPPMRSMRASHPLRPILGRIALAISASLASVAPSSADLGWFGDDDPTRPSPIRLSEVVAWSDACLSIADDEWDDVVRLHREYVAGWRMPEGTVARDAAADRKFVEALALRLGEGRAPCLAAMRAWREVPTRLANDRTSGATLRREILTLATASDAATPEARLRAQELAAELCRRLSAAVGRGGTRPGDELAVLVRAMLPLRASLVEALGEARAGRLMRTIALRADIVAPVLHGAKVRTLLEFADRLTPDERAGVAEAFARADAALDAILLEGRGLPAAESERDVDVETPEGRAQRSSFERAWLAARGAGERALAEDLSRVLGNERLFALRMLSLEGRGPLPSTEEGNAAADAALAAYVDPARFDDLAAALGVERGARPWHPLGIVPFGEEELVAMRVPRAWTVGLLRAALDPARADDAALAVIDTLHAGHLDRVRANEDAHGRTLPRPRAYAEAMAREDETLLAEVGAAFGEEGAPAARRSLALLARAELGTDDAPRGTSLANVWIAAPERGAGSVALLALGVDAPSTLPLSEADRALLAQVLGPFVEDLRRALLGASTERAVDADGSGASWALARAGRDARAAVPWFEAIRRLLEAIRGSGADEATCDRVARAVHAAVIESPFDGLPASKRLEPLLGAQPGSRAAIEDDDGAREDAAIGASAIESARREASRSEASRSESSRRDTARIEIAELEAARLNAISRILEGSAEPMQSIRARVAACRAIAGLATDPDGEAARAAATSGSRAWIESSYASAWRREAAMADAWRVLRAAGFIEARDAFTP